MIASQFTETNVVAPPSLRRGNASVLSWARPGALVNEDAALVVERDDTILMAVTDGVGGLPGGDRAARRALEALGHAFSGGAGAEESLEQANEAVRQLRGPACTIVAATVHEHVLRTYVVGDSQAVLLGGRGRIKAVTLPQNVVGYGAVAGLIDPSDVAHHPMRNVVTNILGDPHLSVTRTHWGELAPRDTLLLASDGLFDALPFDAIARLGRTRPIDDMVRELAEAARDELGAPFDDLTIVAYRLS